MARLSKPVLVKYGGDAKDLSPRPRAYFPNLMHSTTSRVTLDYCKLPSGPPPHWHDDTDNASHRGDTAYCGHKARRCASGQRPKPTQMDPQESLLDELPLLVP